MGPKGIWTTGIVFVVFLVAAGFALWAATGEDVWAQIRLITGGQILLLLVLSLFNYLFRGLRWHLFQTALGIPLSRLAAIRHYLGGFGLTMTPARLGELVRLRWITQESALGAERVAPLVVVDRAGDLAAMAVVLGVALGFSATGIAGGLPVAILALVAAVLATRPKTFEILIGISYRLTGWQSRLFVKGRRAARALGPFSRAGVVLPALALGVAGWFAEAYAFHLLLLWMGVDIGLWSAVAIFIFAMISGGATGMPGGVGGAEAVMIALLTLEGVPLEAAIPATAIIRITTLWFAVGLGIATFPLAEGYAARKKHALENG